MLRVPKRRSQALLMSCVKATRFAPEGPFAQRLGREVRKGFFMVRIRYGTGLSSLNCSRVDQLRRDLALKLDGLRTVILRRRTGVLSP
jgi:hypothetical protein